MMRLIEIVRNAFTRPTAPPGRSAEDLAARELKKRGFRILERNVRFRRGEIDIVARDGECLVIVEVKSLKDPPPGFTPSMHVSAAKRKRLIRLARAFCAAKGFDGLPVRFDLVSVTERGGKPEIEIFERAFDADGRWA